MHQIQSDSTREGSKTLMTKECDQTTCSKRSSRFINEFNTFCLKVFKTFKEVLILKCRLPEVLSLVFPQAKFVCEK